MSDVSIDNEIKKRLSRIAFFKSLVRELQSTEEYAKRPFDWKQLGEGAKYSPELLWNNYHKMLEYARATYMTDSTILIDRHKIVALTQAIVLRVLPLEFISKDSASEDELIKLNADFAFLFAIHFICKMNEEHYPKERFVNQENRFNTREFLYPLLKTKEGQNFVREHKKYLTAIRKVPYPLFLFVQLWTVIEQWGLAYARSQKIWPQEKSLT